MKNVGERFVEGDVMWEVTKVESDTVYFASRVGTDGKKKKGRPHKFGVSVPSSPESLPHALEGLTDESQDWSLA